MQITRGFGSLGTKEIGNLAFKNLQDGFFLDDDSDGNTLEDNEAKNNDEFGFEDEDSAANDYTSDDNKCVENKAGGSNPTDLCSPQN